MRVDLKGRHLSFTEIAKLVGENWQSLPPNEKEPYETQAFNMKEKYNAELAEYKKTEDHRKYMEYLNEFKEKQAGIRHGKRVNCNSGLDKLQAIHDSDLSSRPGRIQAPQARTQGQFWKQWTWK
jgi:hypothetical protein